MENQNIKYIKNILNNGSLNVNSDEKLLGETDEFKNLYKSISNSGKKNNNSSSRLYIDQEQNHNADDSINHRNSTMHETKLTDQNIFTNTYNNINLPTNLIKNRNNNKSIINDLLDFDFNDNDNMDDENSNILSDILMEELSEDISNTYKNVKEEISSLVYLLKKDRQKTRKSKELHDDIGMMILAIDYLNKLFTQIEDRKPKEDNNLNKKVENISCSDKEIYITVLGGMENTNKLANFLVLTKKISKWEIFKVNPDSVSIYIWAKDNIYFYDIIEIAHSLEIDVLPF